jgi:type II secretory pathway pseudopilin PulG
MPRSSDATRALRARRPRHAGRARPGFSIIEVVVAMVLLGVSLSTLGVLAFTASRRNSTVANAAYRSGAMRLLVDRYSAIAFDDLVPATQALDSTITTGAMPHRLQAQFVTTGVLANERRVRLIVTPSNALIQPETVTVRRFRWSSTNPLNTGT